MRLHVISDLHLEFDKAGQSFQPSGVECDIVILAGDIATGIQGVETAKHWFPGVPKLYVPGNHEYYNHELSQLDKAIEESARESEVTILNPRTVAVNDVVFIGCTLWTDFLVFGDQKIVIPLCEVKMADYHCISFKDQASLRNLRVQDTIAIHIAHRRFLEQELEKYKNHKRVVISHHLPHRRCVHRRYSTDLMTNAFASDLADLIEEYQPELWIHGHSHSSTDFRVGNTRILSNQRGYPRETTQFVPDLIVEV